MARRPDKHWLDAPEWWKRYKPLRWLAVLGIIFFVVTSVWTVKTYVLPAPHAETEAFTAVAADPVPFLDNFKSYSTLADAQARFEAAKVEFTVKSSRPPASSKYPPRNRDTLVAGKYVHLGVEGQLTLEYFNDRLYEATFVPSTVDDYVDKLHAADKRLKRDRTGRAERVVGNLRVASNVDFADTEVGRNLRTKPYVIWQDLRLTQQLDDWDARFVALPIQRQD